MKRIRTENPGVAVEIRNLGVCLHKINILEEVSCTIPAGRTTAIIGPNGAGKTTLLLALLGLVPYTGTIHFNDNGKGHPLIGYVPQRLDLDRGLPCTVRDLMMMAVTNKPLWLGKRKKVWGEIRERLGRVGALGLENRIVGKLSGGELQRILLAVALEGDPEILLLDEPTAGIDAPGEQLFCDLLSDIQAEADLTVILISHDLSMVSNHAHQVICLNKTVRCSGGLSTLTEENLLKTFGLHVHIYPHDHGPHNTNPPPAP
ncbi:MAG TPA: metal ABC transporter ATP-binding protein [Thermodesulfobacteriota bacterium]|nr:metal ABC transporter ATP-binding protein [Thermodesulfobacteriota bacterium]